MVRNSGLVSHHQSSREHPIVFTDAVPALITGYRLMSLLTPDGKLLTPGWAEVFVLDTRPSPPYINGS